jgi:hypothetical protein
MVDKSQPGKHPIRGIATNLDQVGRGGHAARASLEQHHAFGFLRKSRNSRGPLISLCRRARFSSSGRSGSRSLPICSAARCAAFDADCELRWRASRADARPSSTRSRIASDREPTFSLAAQRSIAAVSSAGSRTAEAGLRSVGRPRAFIVFAIQPVCQKTEPQERERSKQHLASLSSCRATGVQVSAIADSGTGLSRFGLSLRRAVARVSPP